jgi:superfamily II DNA or RNA helicase
LAIWSDTPAEERKSALQKLANKEVNVIFSVDLFNEGVDVPSVDTLFMLRPTESPTLFLQQLGRGLRKHDTKSVCTVLDFVGRQHQDFRFDVKLRASAILEEGLEIIPNSLRRERQALKARLEELEDLLSQDNTTDI